MSEMSNACCAKEPSLRSHVEEIIEMLSVTAKELNDAELKLYLPRQILLWMILWKTLS